MGIQIIDKTTAKLIVSTGSGHKNNRQRYTRRVKYTGKKDLEKQYAEFKREVLNDGRPDSLTVAELLSWYIDRMESLGARPTTISGYKSTAKRVNLTCGAIKANELTTYKLEKDIALNRKYSPKTVKNTVSLLSAAYKKAIDVGMLSENPCEKVQQPKMTKKEVQILAPENLQAFVCALDNEPPDFSVACKLALFCGLRRSEILGITEAAISDVSNIITITQGRHRIGTEDRLTEPKTAKSRRSVAVPASLMNEIRELVKMHRASPFGCCDFLLQDEFGDPMKPNYLTQHIATFERNNDLPRVSFHALRHSHASMLNAQGVDIARISAQLGHSTIGTTMNIYTHVFGSPLQSTQEIAEAMETKITKMGHLRGTPGGTKAAETQ